MSILGAVILSRHVMICSHQECLHLSPGDASHATPFRAWLIQLNLAAAYPQTSTGWWVQ
jgi:hypothetical protein